MKAAQNVIGGAGTIGELFRFLWTRRVWWMIPVATLLLVAVLLMVGQATGIAPFIYPLF
jgi:hypothetical protein